MPLCLLWSQLTQ